MAAIVGTRRALSAAALIAAPRRCISQAAIEKGHIPLTDIEARMAIAKQGLQDTVPTCTSAQENVFAWLGLSPKPGSPCWKALHTNFPGALPDSAVYHRCKDLLTSRGITPENTLLGRSICPDEINNAKGDLSDMLKEYYRGKSFPLGGIGGPPFVGKTGWGAFSAHVPDGGNIIILFGPHVGITEDGQVGMVHREGQKAASTACGALVAAYNSCIAGERICRESHKHDLQQLYLKESIEPRVQDIKTTPEPMAALAVHGYEIVKEALDDVVSKKVPGGGNMVLIGGIQINMPARFEDHFFPLKFDIRSAAHPEPESFLDVFSCEQTGKGSMVEPVFM